MVMKRMVTMTLVNTDSDGTEIKTNVAVRAMLEALGWNYDGNCNCNGQYSDKYFLPVGAVGEKYQMKVRRSSFLLKGPRENIFRRIPIALLKTTVDEINGISE